MKHLIRALLLLLTSTLLLFSSEPILKLDTGGHRGLIKDIIITKSGDIISASEDKTIRVWDSKTGKEKRKILGKIGSGNYGKIYAIALSPDEEFLAVGVHSRKFNQRIRIYNYKTGKLLKLLIKSHNDVIYDLAFSSDGKYLISGSADSTAKIWSVGSFKLLDTIIFHKKEVSAVKILKKDNRYFALTAGFDQQIALYDMKKRKVIKSDQKAYILNNLAISKKHIAVNGFGRKIQIYDHSLNPIRTISSETLSVGLAYSANGEFLIAGSGDHPRNVNIYSVKKKYKKKSSFHKHTNVTVAVAFLNNTTAISAGGSNYEIYQWDIQTAKVKKKIEGVGATVWSVGVKGDIVGWGNKVKSVLNSYNNQKTLNLKTFSIRNGVANQRNYNRISTTQANYTLSHKAGGDYGHSNAILELKRGGRLVASMTRDFTNGVGHDCYGFYGEYIISGGSHGRLTIYNRKGYEVANLVGHTGSVWSIAVEGDRLVSGSGDQTIRVWDLSELKEGSEIQQIEPQLNIFVSKDNEWVVWSKSGYYNASALGDKYIGYHINQGTDKEAYFVSSDKYADTLYRPDIIDAIIAGSSEKRAIESSSTRVATVDVASSLPPMLSLLSPSRLSTDAKRIIVKFNMQSSAKVEKVIVTRNGQSLSNRGLGQTRDGTRSMIEVELEDGENIISIRAKNKFALSDELLVTATKTSQSETIYKPTLYLLTVGVSKYENKEYNLELADIDAKSIAKMFAYQEGKLYKKVVSKSLLNEQATRDNILDALDWIERETTQRDVVVIFTAGHGQNDDKGNFYFLSHDTDAQKLRRTAIKWTEIKDTITSLPSKVILMADACHSGNIMGKGRRRDITGAIKSIINSGTGAIILTASTDRGYSIEDKKWGHGAFTKAILEGLGEGKADYNQNDTIEIKEIELYVTDRVKELTDGRQKPTTIIPQSVPDFAVGVR